MAIMILNTVNLFIDKDRKTCCIAQCLLFLQVAAIVYSIYWTYITAYICYICYVYITFNPYIIMRKACRFVCCNL